MRRHPLAEAVRTRHLFSIMSTASPGHRPQFSHTTVFFRNRPQLEEWAGTLLPRVWPEGAAGLEALVCGGSTGCEAYSFLAALREFGPGGTAALRARVLSIDVAETVTAQGRAGRFPEEAFRPLHGMEGGMPEDVRARWFTAEEGGRFWRPQPELGVAEFQTLDLLAAPLAWEFDLLVCQNVLTHLTPPVAATLLARLLDRAKARAVFVCSGVDLDLKARIAAAGFRPWTGRLEEIHEAFATHRMHYRLNRGQHYFELEDIDRARPDWEARYSTLFYRCP
ncbi:MAG: hypothetical protein INR65_17525 [Gluconacetobacter diazotrophicus]|nr:hypothetical protein [Gluconacetobacter diazotrophicus]